MHFTLKRNFVIPSIVTWLYFYLFNLGMAVWFALVSKALENVIPAEP